MTETGVVNKFRRDAETGERGDNAILDNVMVLGYENVALPFMALLTGLAVAFVLFAIEVPNIFKSNLVKKIKMSPTGRRLDGTEYSAVTTCQFSHCAVMQ